jgi:hypothetical protein
MFRVENQLSLASCLHTGFLLSWFSTLKVEVIRSSETSAQIWTSRLYIPDEATFKQHSSFTLIGYQFVSEMYWGWQRYFMFRVGVGLSLSLSLFLAWVETGPTWYFSHYLTVCTSIELLMMMGAKQSVELVARETEILGENLKLCLPQIPHDLSLARTRSTFVGSWRLTAWATAWP